MAAAGALVREVRLVREALNQGRGVHVDGIEVTSQGRTVFANSWQRDADAMKLMGWSAAST